jgi:glycosyltransferase involved in cell wall biosynthesis
MRLGIYYDILTGRNDGNPLYVWNDLKKRQGIEVVHLAPKEDIKLFGKFDANIWVDWGEDGLKPFMPYEMVLPERPRIYWASDTHIGYDYRLETAKKFDHVFVAQKKAVEDFKRDGVEAEWLPHAFEPQAYPYQTMPLKEFDVCFVGHINNDKRLDFLDHMFKKFPNFFYGQRLFERAAEAYGRSKINLNIAHSDDVNMRVFEIMGSGGFLLTEYVPSLEELFKNRKHLVWYKDLDEAVDMATYYIHNDEARQKIAEEGYREVLKNHTITKRVDRMIEVINQLRTKEGASV